MNSPAGEKLKRCPVCKKWFLPRAISNHIVQISQREIYNIYLKKGYVALGSSGHEHEDFRKKNQKSFKKFSYDKNYSTKR
jgi:hypothetical protein